jgi:hypothetical protein
MHRSFLLQVAALVIAAGAVPRTISCQASTENPDSVGRRRLQPLPAVASAPETGLQFGATMLGRLGSDPPLRYSAKHRYSHRCS